MRKKPLKPNEPNPNPLPNKPKIAPLKRWMTQFCLGCPDYGDLCNPNTAIGRDAMALCMFAESTLANRESPDVFTIIEDAETALDVMEKAGITPMEMRD